MDPDPGALDAGRFEEPDPPELAARMTPPIRIAPAIRAIAKRPPAETSGKRRRVPSSPSARVLGRNTVDGSCVARSILAGRTAVAVGAPFTPSSAWPRALAS